VAREVRRVLQPELEVLTRAIRRAEKRTMTLAIQTDARLQRLNSGLDDSIALAAAAAKSSAAAAGPGIVRSLLDSLTALILLPFNATVSVFVFPFRTLSSVLGKGRPVKSLAQGPRGRQDRYHMPPRMRDDRLIPASTQFGRR
jgi:hypothetical protein